MGIKKIREKEIKMRKESERKKEVKKLLNRHLKSKNAMNDLAIHTKIFMSLTREETKAMYRYHDIIKFIAGISAYDEILFILRKDKTKFGKDTFKKLLATRRKIAREHRKDRRNHEALFKKKTKKARRIKVTKKKNGKNTFL